MGMSWMAMILAACVFCNVKSSSTNNLPVGEALNLLRNYGDLDLFVKVFPFPNDTNGLFLERTAEVFQKNYYWRPSYHQQHPSDETRRGYDQDFLIDFCDDPQKLLVAYFHHFHIEGIPESSKAFTGSHSIRTIADYFGIHRRFFEKRFSFVLVRLLRRARRATMAGDLTLNDHFKTAMRDIRIGSTESVLKFLESYGTHVITEYEVGDIVYQVFVIRNFQYRYLKRMFAQSQSNQTNLQLMERYFNPIFALEVGSVRLASGNPEFENVVGDRLTSKTQFFWSYQSILKVLKNEELKAQLEMLEGEVVLSLKLEKITKIIPPKSPERHWLREILDNTLNLFYVTLYNPIV